MKKAKKQDILLQKRAIKKAKKSYCRFKVSAIGFDHNGNYLGSSVNSPRFDRFNGGLHAEMRLFARYGKQLKNVFICRVGNSGYLLPIHPCKTCAEKARELGIKIETISMG